MFQLIQCLLQVQGADGWLYYNAGKLSRCFFQSLFSCNAFYQKIISLAPSAWLFLVMNLFKLPFQVFIGENINFFKFAN
jgi:hypothetical protein